MVGKIVKQMPEENTNGPQFVWEFPSTGRNMESEITLQSLPSLVCLCSGCRWPLLASSSKDNSNEVNEQALLAAQMDGKRKWSKKRCVRNHLL